MELIRTSLMPLMLVVTWPRRQGHGSTTYWKSSETTHTASVLGEDANWERRAWMFWKLQVATVLRDYFPAAASQEDLVFLYNGVEEFKTTLCFGQAGQDAALSRHTFFRETEWVPFVQHHGIKQGDTVSFDRIWYPNVLRFFIALLVFFRSVINWKTFWFLSKAMWLLVLMPLRRDYGIFYRLSRKDFDCLCSNLAATICLKTTCSWSLCLLETLANHKYIYIFIYKVSFEFMVFCYALYLIELFLGLIPK